MKKRSLIFVFIIYIITLGIYGLYWLYSTRKEMVAMGQKIRPFWMLFVPIVLTVLWTAVLVMNSTIRNETLSADYAVISSVMMGVGIISAIVLTILFISSFCRAVENVTKKRLEYRFNLAMAIIIAIVGLPLIWHLLNQYYFNQLPTPKASNSKGAQPA